MQNKGIKVDVDSCGLLDIKKQINPNTEEVLKENGIPYKANTSKICTKELIENNDFIFTMTDKQQEVLIKLFGNEKKIISLSKFNGEDVFDPHGLGVEAYREVYKMFNGLLGKLSDFIGERISK